MRRALAVALAVLSVPWPALAAKPVSLSKTFLALAAVEINKIQAAGQALKAGTYPGCGGAATRTDCLRTYLAKEPAHSVTGMVMQLTVATGLTLEDAKAKRLDGHYAVLRLVDDDLDVAEALDPERSSMLAVVALKPASGEAKTLLANENKLARDTFAKLVPGAERFLEKAASLPPYDDAMQEGQWETALQQRQQRLEAFKKRPVPQLAWRSPTRIAVAGNPFYVSFPGTPFKKTGDGGITEYRLANDAYTLIAQFGPAAANERPADDWQRMMTAEAAQSLGCNASGAATVCAAVSIHRGADGASSNEQMRGLYASGAKALLMGLFPVGRPVPRQLNDFMASAGASF